MNPQKPPKKAPFVKFPISLIELLINVLNGKPQQIGGKFTHETNMKYHSNRVYYYYCYLLSYPANIFHMR